ncbi:hypothetical protein [Lentilactobacillus sp. SPB1-3]|uniref:Uncharacterized protein n=1 Tax=Lentilactobacillus terminaliae TaxID=3003483 RepID=A0ACD5DD65_9LACO|nr:hypothetical protein [Lentilactobacillus sp. SPB1-3]MCZ0978088.1 hypothetical protein [Lentilactobacillus sp. SPB1-3]
MSSGADEIIQKLRMQQRRLKQLNNNQANVGAFKNVPEHTPEELQKIVRWNEFGTAKIPARSFLRGASARNRKHSWKFVAGTALKSVLNGKLTGNQAYQMVGKQMADDVRKQIDTIGPPNAAATVKLKGRNQPLVDTGGLYRSIDEKVTKRDH